VGLGSVAFHGTLYKFAQALDEVPMLYCVFTFTFITLCQRYKLSAGWRSFLATCLILHAITTTLLITLFEGPLQFALFHISFNTAHFYALYEAFKVNQRRRNLIKEKHRKALKAKSSKNYMSIAALKKKLTSDPCLKAFEMGSFFYVLAIGCWLFDMFLCEFVNPAYSSSVLPLNPQLHAWWHVFISIGLYYMALLLLLDRMEYLNGFDSTEIKYAYYCIPFVLRTAVGQQSSPSDEKSRLQN
jgi:dihydroceramidase